MARPDTLIDELRSRIGKLGEAFDGLAGVKRRYVALGGADFLAPYFLDGTGAARTDLDIAPEDIGKALQSLQAIEALLATVIDPATGATHMTNFARLIR